MASSIPFTEEDLHELYLWVDEIPISRPKRNIARDFADGCCVAEMVHFFFPKLVDLHNYNPSMSRKNKLDNWNTLNTHVFRKLYFEVPPEEIEDIITAVPGAIERFLRALRTKIAQIKARREELLLEGGAAAGDYPRDSRLPASQSARASRGGPRGGVVDDEEAYPAVVAPHAMRASSGSARPASASRLAGSQRLAPASHSTPSATVATGHGESTGVTAQLMNEKDRTILELRETVGILSEKIVKLEELVRVKDEKLAQYRAKFGKV